MRWPHVREDGVTDDVATFKFTVLKEEGEMAPQISPSSLAPRAPQTRSEGRREAEKEEEGGRASSDERARDVQAESGRGQAGGDRQELARAPAPAAAADGDARPVATCNIAATGRCSIAAARSAEERGAADEKGSPRQEEAVVAGATQAAQEPLDALACPSIPSRHNSVTELGQHAQHEQQAQQVQQGEGETAETQEQQREPVVKAGTHKELKPILKPAINETMYPPSSPSALASRASIYEIYQVHAYIHTCIPLASRASIYEIYQVHAHKHRARARARAECA